MIGIDSERICLFDDSIVDFKKTTAYKIEHEPVRREKVINFSNPWEKEIAHPCLVKDDDRYLLYYIAGVRIDEKKINEIDSNDVDSLRKVVDNTIRDTFHVCLAVSDDGIHFKEDNYGISFKSINNTNIILNDPVEFYVMKDKNPKSKADEKFKAIYHKGFRLYAMHSSDGIHFIDDGLIQENGGSFDSLNTVYYDETLNKYVAYVRGFHRVDQIEYPDFDDKQKMIECISPLNMTPEELYKIRGIRDIRVMYSNDFKNWTRPERINLFNDNGITQYYTNSIQPYYRSNRYLIGFPMRYCEKPCWEKPFDELCGKKEREFRYKLDRRFGIAFTDSCFIYSTNRKDFYLNDAPFLRPGIETDYKWKYGDCCIAPNIIETINEDGIKEISLYTPSGLWGFPTSLVRYSLRLDGFVSYRGNKKETHFVTKPFKFTGDKLFMNLSTSAYGIVKVKLTDNKGHKATSCDMFGDSTEKKIIFNCDLTPFVGNEVVMDVLLKEADIYSFVFRS